jgi:hypothetical protein
MTKGAPSGAPLRDGPEALLPDVGKAFGYFLMPAISSSMAVVTDFGRSMG